jgi:23S rRNA pseudouridine1911/1915/1917 synthase
MDMRGNDLEYKADAGDAGLKIKELLKRRLQISTRLMRKLKNGAGVTCNSLPAPLNAKVQAGDRIAVSFPRESSGFEPEPIPIRVIFEDADLLILDKQPGFVVHPTKGHPCHTIANGVMRYMLETGESYKTRFINRLDMDTSGVLLIGKNAYSQEDFTRQAAAGRVTKRYLAVVTGRMEKDADRIDLPIDKAEADQVKRIVRADGFPSVTRYQVLERFAAHTLLSLELQTGRTHQIRVHLAHIGHPVLGDALYGRPAPRLIERQALHADSLHFDHPRAKERVRACAALPADMEALLKRLG